MIQNYPRFNEFKKKIFIFCLLLSLLTTCRRKTEVDRRLIWKYKTELPIFKDVEHDDKYLYYLGEGIISNEPASILYAFDITSRQIVLKIDNHGANNISLFAIHDKVLYYGDLDGNITALHTETKKTLWTVNIGGPMNGKPLFKDNNIYIGNLNGYIFIFNAKSGLEVNKLGPYPKAIGEMNFSLDKKILIFSSNYRLHALEAIAYNEIWQIEVFDHINNSALTTMGKLLLPTNNGNLYNIDINSGKQLWKYKADSSITSVAEEDNGNIYFGSVDHKFYALNETGEKIWAYEAPDAIYSAPVKIGIMIYFGCNDGYLYALDINSGMMKWKFKTLNNIVSRPLMISENTLLVAGTDGNIYLISTK